MTTPQSRRTGLLVAVTVLASVGAAARQAGAPEAPQVIIYKNAQCGCCSLWGRYLTDAGFLVEERVPDSLAAVFAEHAVTPELQSCHVAVVDGYAVVGHVPVAEIQRMLRERPAIAGIAVPGMPTGAPGMESPDAEPAPFDVLAFDRDGGTSVYARN